jgi:hypothetical protein
VRVLQCELSGIHPRGFDPAEFEGLWIFVAAWLGRQGRTLAMPGPETGLRRFVALPLCHVPLRQVDIDRLPAFFHWAAYEAGETPKHAKIEGDFEKWMKQNPLTGAGLEAWRDQRRGAVLAQVMQELGCWDGTLVDSQGRGWAPVEILLAWRQRRPVLSYLARRPPGFPLLFADGNRTLEAGVDGWYEPDAIQQDEGPQVAAGIQWEASHARGSFILSRPQSSVISLIPSEFSGWISHHGLVQGAECHVLCAGHRSAEVGAYLETIAGSAKPADLAGLLAGWQLFARVKPLRRIAPPPGLESLEVISSGQILLQGGLRLGRRSAWIRGSPPRIQVLGFAAEEKLTINGVAADRDGEGIVSCSGLLETAGIHLVEIGSAQRRIEIEEPAQPVCLVEARRDWAVALPPGSWMVLGSRHEESAPFHSEPGEPGILARVPFEPVWAVSSGQASRGAVVICFAPAGRQPAVVPARRRPHVGTRRWADSIFGANIRRPHVVMEEGQENEDLPRLWRTYVAAARQIKRRLREGRR